MRRQVWGVRFHRFRCRLAWRAKADVGDRSVCLLAQPWTILTKNALFCGGREMQHWNVLRRCSPICCWERLFEPQRREAEREVRETLPNPPILDEVEKEEFGESAFLEFKLASCPEDGWYVC